MVCPIMLSDMTSVSQASGRGKYGDQSKPTFCMRDFSAGRVVRSTWIDSCSRDRQVCAKAASKARSSKGNVRSMELQHINSIDQQLDVASVACMAACNRLSEGPCI